MCPVFGNKTFWFTYGVLIHRHAYVTLQYTIALHHVALNCVALHTQTDRPVSKDHPTRIAILAKEGHS